MTGELIYARSPSPGEVEIVVSKNHEAEAYPLDDYAIIALYSALSEAVRERLVRSVSQARETSSGRLDGHQTASGVPSRSMVNPDREGLILLPGLGYFKDKSHRKYGTRPA